MPLLSLRRVLVAATATTAAAALAAGGVDAAYAAHAATPKTPSFFASNTGKSYKLTYSKKIQAGYLRVVVTDTKGNGAGVQIVSFPKSSKGLTFKQYVADQVKVQTDAQKSVKTASREFKSVLKRVQYWGGAGVSEGVKSSVATIYLPVGQYVIYDDNGELPANAHAFDVVAPTAKRATPKYAQIVSMVDGERFGGYSTLTHKGAIRVENKSSDSPHFLVLQRVKNGTTRKQVADYLNGGAQGEPAFAAAGSVETDTLNPGNTQFLTYSLPKGEYVEVCFFPDENTLMPHAFMGMYKIVTLK